MKKLIFTLLLVLTMVSSIAAGTLAMYSVSIDSLAEGSVVAKEFIFVGEGTDSFQQGIKIAPSETVNWQFKVKNYQNHVVSETDLYYKLTFHVFASPGKNAIQPLVVTVKDLDGHVLNSVTGVGNFDVLGSFPLSEYGQGKDYIVEIHWPGDGRNDKDYAGDNYGTTVNVDALASQVPLNGSGHENPPQGKAVSVLYQTTAPWENGHSGKFHYEYKVTITNNTLQPIDDWSMAFTLPTDRPDKHNYWNAVLVSSSPPGSYRFNNPHYNDSAADKILPGQSVSFGGLADGMGTEAIQNISVDGSNTTSITDVELTCEFGKASLN